jgi:imidazolonepropionase-like amidohydrolase
VIRDVVDARWAEPGSLDAEVEIGEECWALPGLVDAHAHIASDTLFTPGDIAAAPARLRDSLAAGVTLILDKGWTDDTTIRAADSVPLNERPDVEAAAEILTVESGYFPGFGMVIDPDQVSEGTTRQAAAGTGWVKLIGDWPRRGVGPVANFTTEQLRAAVVAAEAAGARVAIHTMAPDVPGQAVAAGVHSIEHGLFLSEDDLVLLGERVGMWVPTMLRTEETLAQLGSESSGGRLLTAGLENTRRLLGIAVDAGVRVLAGTDLVGSPANIASEAIRMGEIGLSNGQVIDAISTAGLLATGRDATFTVGSSANAVLFADDPKENLEILRHPQHIVRLGRLL